MLEPVEWSDDNSGVIFYENNDRISERVLQRTRAVVVHFCLVSLVTKEDLIEWLLDHDVAKYISIKVTFLCGLWRFFEVLPFLFSGLLSLDFPQAIIQKERMEKKRLKLRHSFLKDL